jgi:hypothetical protein
VGGVVTQRDGQEAVEGAAELEELLRRQRGTIADDDVGEDE